MKIKQADYQALKDMIQGYLERQDMNINYLIKDYRTQKLSDKRLAWDLLRASGGIKYVCDVLYAYLNDVHIDTALRNILKDMSLRSLNCH